MAPILLLMGLGYTAAHVRLISREQLQGIGQLVMYFALPALIIRALTENPLGETIDPYYLLAYGLASIVLFTLVLYWTCRVSGRPLSTGAMYALGISASNSAFSGYPIASMVLGPSAATFLAQNMIIENLLILPAALIIAELGQHQRGNRIATFLTVGRRLIRNPLLLALCIGVALAILEIQLPGPLSQVIDMLANATAPTALFAVGGALYGLQVRGLVSSASLIVFGKLVLHPLAMLITFSLIMPGSPDALAGALLFASVPMISIFPLICQRYSMGNIGAGALFIASLASFVTITCVIALMSYFGLLMP
ncbi:hypothetical protein BJB45_04785 [Halomonas huangheensis]|uniref:Permease n=2 Tax=Halomonas huangheensis TaxID=1178482 RepID=W1N4M0_9GAMM|nr:hypothetical protein BJB45_04785 [Halomonas huangheensis]